MDVSDIFYFFFVRGRGRGSPRRQEGGIGFFIPGGGGGVPRGGRAEGPGGCLRRFGGGGGEMFFFFFFFGVETSTKNCFLGSRLVVCRRGEISKACECNTCRGDQT